MVYNSPRAGVSSFSSTRTLPLRNCPGKYKRLVLSKSIKNLTSLRDIAGLGRHPVAEQDKTPYKTLPWSTSPLLHFPLSPFLLTSSSHLIPLPSHRCPCFGFLFGFYGGGSGSYPSLRGGPISDSFSHS